MPMRPPPRVVLLVLTVAIALLVGLSMPAAPLSGRTQVRSTSAERDIYMTNEVFVWTMIDASRVNAPLS